MKFIFPQNYDFTNKIFGFIDYPTALFLLCWSCCIILILHIFINNLTLKFVLFIIFCFPLFLFSIIGFNNENILYVLSYLLKFAFKRKCLFFDKSS